VQKGTVIEGGAAPRVVAANARFFIKDDLCRVSVA
jgi:hypothetical protein